MRVFAAGELSTLLFTVPSLAAQPAIRKEKVEFGNEQSTKTLKGNLQGDQIVDYTVTVAGGQRVMVSLQASSTSTYFNITAPGEDAALFIGSTSGNTFKGPLPKTGDYTVRVYQMRNAARRGQKSNYSITFAIVRGGGAKTATGG